jgi:TPR repeat protein
MSLTQREAAGRLMAERLLGHAADLDSPYAHFVGSKWRDLMQQGALYENVDLRAMLATLAAEWSKLSDAEKAASPSFAAAAAADLASSSSTATAAADEKRDATVGDAASTSAAANGDRASLEPRIDEGTAYAKKLYPFVQSYVLALRDDMKYWVQSEYGGDLRRLRADADRGDAKAQLAMSFFTTDGNVARVVWLNKSAERGYGDAMIVSRMVKVRGALDRDELSEASITKLRDTIESTGSAELQHLMGLIEGARQQPTADKDDVLETAKWFRAAAHEGLKEAQWELGEMFRKGVFCDVQMFFAHRYIEGAARQGHAEALQRVQELCRCVYCGAANAPWKFSTCLETRYCNSTCSTAHWRRGGGVSEVCGAALPHRKTCPRTYEDPCEA